MFLHGLADRVQKEIYILDLPQSLNGLIDLALRVDARLDRVERYTRPDRRLRGAESRWTSDGDTVGPVVDPRSHAGRESSAFPGGKRETEIHGLCLYCGATGHFIHSPWSFTSVRGGGRCVRGGGRCSSVWTFFHRRQDASLRVFVPSFVTRERNYDIGNRELLAVKLALEEWRHWLEGSGFPFIVWTDHKNLEYIRSAKRT